MFAKDTKLYQISQIRLFEKLAIEQLGIPEFTLMHRAGLSAFHTLQQKWPNARKILVVCGKGNNGGDGYLTAKFAKEHKMEVMVRYIGELTSFSENMQEAFNQCQAADIDIKPFSASEKWDDVDVIVDAILGIGIKSDVRESYKEAISSINETYLPILAIDVPSGVDADTGKICGIAIKAHTTVTFIGFKRGLFTGEALNYCGEVVLNHLGIPLNLYDEVIPSARLLMTEQIREQLPIRERNSQKGDFGHVLIIGGEYGMAGAVRLAAQSALRVGSGLVTVATREGNSHIVCAQYPEIMCHEIRDAQDLQPLLSRATVVVIGPGLGKDEWGRNLFENTIKVEQPKIVDADGLNLLAEHPFEGKNWILTPHPGEAARLLNLTSAKEIQQNRFAAIEKLCKKYNATVVLKGAGTLIKNTQSGFLICSLGNPGMATAGMGDVLSGIVGGLLAQHLLSLEAASVGVLVHALAGDKAAEKGQRGLLATDLINEIRGCINS